MIDSHGSPHPYPPSDSPVTISNSPSSPQAGLACMRNLFSPLGTMLSHISGQARPTCILSSRCTGYLLFGLYHPLIMYGMRHTTNIDHLNPVLFLLHRHNIYSGPSTCGSPTATTCTYNIPSFNYEPDDGKLAIHPNSAASRPRSLQLAFNSSVGVATHT